MTPLRRAVGFALDAFFALWLVLLSLFFLLRFSFVFYQANAEAIRAFFR